jgi:hypothetical protein
MKKLLLTFFAVAAILIFSNSVLRSNSSGAAKDYSGFKTNCNQQFCHQGNTLNDTSKGYISVKLLDQNNFAITNGKYKRNTEYIIELICYSKDTSKYKTYGMCCQVIADKLSLPYGNFKADQNTKMSSDGQYVTHKVTDQRKFTYRWKSPDDNLNSTIYIAMNLANGNKAASGDYIYTQKVTFKEESVGIEERESNFSAIKIRTNPVMDNAILDFGLKSVQNLEVEIYSLQGKKVYQQNFGKMVGQNQMIEVPASNLQNGQYIVKVTAGGDVQTMKLLKM